ncbi:hypothetical protein THRCLA_02273 [Thraustotheca clavata]|uniref:MAGE domain-containing protein n=1 Tax=Thraustotheca clavata TaxID=74557 RepID=A0A1W0A5U3_9STRA|nr:hypothetical protein THRCLA_02273 [Thraustotheca clavata]
MAAAGKRKAVPSRGTIRRQRARVDSDDESEEEVDVQPQRRASQAPPVASDDEENALDFTQPSVPEEVSQRVPSMEAEEEGRVPPRVAQMSKKSISDLTARLVRYLLYKANANMPVKFADIGKEVLQREPKIGRYILKLASAELESVFGYKAVAVDDIMPNVSGKKDVFLIINTIEDQNHLLQVNKCYGKVNRALLMVILAFIWCAPSRRLVEEDLLKQLALVDKSILNTSIKHPQLGDVPLLIKAFESQMYLTSDSEIDGDGKRVKFYTYGARTYAEVGKVQILTFMCKLIHNRLPTEQLLNELAIEMRNEQAP